MPRLGSSFWALADQGVISLGAFLTNVLLARHLPQRDYGVYGILFRLMLFFNGAHSSLVAYPLSVKAAIGDPDSQRSHAGVSLLLTLMLSLLIGAGFLASSLVFDRSSLAWFGVCALVLWQVQETLRRALMAALRQRHALWGDALSYLGQAALLWLVCSRQPISLPTAFGVMAFTSGVAATIQAVQVRPRAATAAELRCQARAFWKLGRLVLASSLLNLLTINSFFWILALLFGPKKTASFQAAFNLLGVSHPVLFSMGNVIVPKAARESLTGGRDAAWRCAVKHAAHCGLLLLPYFGILMIWPQGILHAFYGAQSPYLGLEWAVRLLVPAYVFAFLAHALRAFLASLEETAIIFAAQLSAAVAGLAAGLPLTAWLGVNGASAGLLVVNLLGVGVGTSCALRRRKKPAPAQMHAQPYLTRG